MNTKTGIAIGATALGSAIAGFVIGSFYTRVQFEKVINKELLQLNEEMQEEIQRIRDAYEGKEPDEEQTETFKGVAEGTPEEKTEAQKLIDAYTHPEVLTEEQAAVFNDDQPEFDPDKEESPFTVDGVDPSELPSDVANGTPAVLEEDAADSIDVGGRFVKDLLGTEDGDDPKADTVDPDEDHSSSTQVMTAEQIEQRTTTGPIKITAKNVFVDYQDDQPSELEHLQSDLERDEHGKIIDERPYVIPVAEYMNGYDDEGLELMTFWWYAGDGTLVDERDIPIRDVEGIVGRANLNHFGVSSEDSRIVYVRNNAKKSAYEILLHDGNYSEVVFGVGGDDTGKTKKTPQKMRKSDD